MALSLFLAKLFGSYLIVCGLFMMFRYPLYEKAIQEFFHNPALIVFSGCLSLLIGFGILFAHPVFEWNWTFLLTFFGLICVLKGIVRFFFLESVREKLERWVLQKKVCFYMGLVLVVWGGFLAYQGFFS